MSNKYACNIFLSYWKYHWIFCHRKYIRKTWYWATTAAKRLLYHKAYRSWGSIATVSICRWSVYRHTDSIDVSVHSKLLKLKVFILRADDKHVLWWDYAHKSRVTKSWVQWLRQVGVSKGLGSYSKCRRAIQLLQGYNAQIQLFLYLRFLCLSITKNKHCYQPEEVRLLYLFVDN